MIRIESDPITTASVGARPDALGAFLRIQSLVATDDDDEHGEDEPLAQAPF